MPRAAPTLLIGLGVLAAGAPPGAGAAAVTLREQPSVDPGPHHR